AVLIFHRLYSHQRITTLQYVSLDKFEVHGVFVEIILFYARYQSAYEKKFPIVKNHSPGPMHHLLNRITPYFFQGSGIININPGIRLARWLIKFPKIHRHIHFPIMVAKITMMIVYGYLMDNLAIALRFDQLVSPAPVNGLLIIHAYAL